MIPTFRILLHLSAALALGACSSIHHADFATTGASHQFQTDANRAALVQALAAADHASVGGFKDVADKQRYNAATERAVAAWLSLSDEAARRNGLEVRSAEGSYRVNASWPENLLFDELIPAHTIKGKELKRHIIRDGVGATFVAHWKYSKDRKTTEPFLTKAGYAVPVTATIEFRHEADGVSRATLVLHDPRVQETVRLFGHEHPLAADLSAFGEFLLAQKAALMPGIKAMLQSGKYMDKLGILAFERPAKDRIPVIFVHGLMSRPATWVNVVNELDNDPIIQRNYQIYFFRYPTGVPVTYSATRFREQIRVLHDQLEQGGNRQLGHHMVLVGHSMGGLVSKMQILESGDRLWIDIFGSRPEKLGLSQEDTRELRQYLEFNPNPYVDRVIFVSTPHRGSELAVGTIGAIGRYLISLPVHVMGNTFDFLKGDAPQNPVLRNLIEHGVPNSIDNFSPKSRFVQWSTSLPMRPGLRVHSIIGNKDGRALTDPKCSDGVVPYTSAHLNGVESELVVHSDHGAHETPEAQAEIRRILRLHLLSL